MHLVSWSQGQLLNPSAASLVCAGMLFLHAILLGHSASMHSATQLEPAHLSSGLLHWETGCFSVGRVNPPLVRLWATIPAYIAGIKQYHPALRIHDQRGERIEYSNGEWLARQDPKVFSRMLIQCRLMCIPFSLVGGFVCYFAARHLFGTLSGLVACALWISSPMILGHAALMTTDVAAASLGALAALLHAAWLNSALWRTAVAAGVVLGLALLTKFTLLLLLPLFAVTAVIQIVGHENRSISCWHRGLQSVMIYIVALIIVNLGYGFERTGLPFRSLDLTSKTFCRTLGVMDASHNWLAGALISKVPLPVPAAFLEGLDLQCRDFESDLPAYVGGQWLKRGVWYYYVYSLLLKTPLGVLLLLSITPASMMALDSATKKACIVNLVLPFLFVFVAVSIQTSINQHPRYCLPAFPYLFVAVSSGLSHKTVGKCLMLARIAAVFTAGAVISGVASHPHSLSFINLAAGGPSSGPQHLLGSSIDWGQDLYLLREWSRDHPECRPLTIVYWGPVPSDVHAEWGDQVFHSRPYTVAEAFYRRGWIAVSVNHLYSDEQTNRKCAALRSTPAADQVGHSIMIFDRR